MRTDFSIFGTAQLARRYGVVGARHSERSNAGPKLLELAAASGFRALDTAPVYGDAESIIGRSNVRLEVHTKLDPTLEPRTSVARSLRRLRRPQLDVLYIHESSLATDDSLGTIDACNSMVGREIGRLGISIYSQREFDAAVMDGRFSVIQVPYNLADRRFAEGMTQMAMERGIDVFARSVLLQGVLVTPPDLLPTPVAHLKQFVREVRTVADRLKRSPLDLTIGWVRHHRYLSGLILGAESIHQVQELARALRSPALGQHEVAALEAIDTPPPEECDPRRWDLAGTGPDDSVRPKDDR